MKSAGTLGLRFGAYVNRFRVGLAFDLAFQFFQFLPRAREASAEMRFRLLIASVLEHHSLNFKELRH